ISTTLSITSRQFAPSTRIESQVHDVHSSDPAPSIKGIVTSSAGGFPSRSFQTNSWPFRSRVRQARVLAATGTRRAYGIDAHRPSGPQRQSWNGQAMAAAREPGRRRARLDGPNLIHTPRLEHVLVLWPCPPWEQPGRTSGEPK